MGKGSGKYRAYRFDDRNKHWKHVTNKHGVVVDIAKDDLEENLAFYLEKFFIKVFGRKNLTNKTDGGEGVMGRVCSEETKKKIGATKVGKKRPDISGENSPFKKYPERYAHLKGDGHPAKRPDVIAKIVAKTKGQVRPHCMGANNSTSKKVVCVETGVVFDCGRDAIRWLKSIGFGKAAPSAITFVCQGKRPVAYGYTWAYA